MAEIRVLTIRQPWAWAIARGHKTVENRSWRTTWTGGPLAIHAASRWDSAGLDALRAVVHQLRDANVPYPRTLADDLPYSGLGSIIAVADLTGICGQTVNTMRRAPIGETWCACGPWAEPGAYHWQLANIRLLAEPIPAKGQLGLWRLELPDHVTA